MATDIVKSFQGYACSDGCKLCLMVFYAELTLQAYFIDHSIVVPCVRVENC